MTDDPRIKDHEGALFLVPIGIGAIVAGFPVAFINLAFNHISASLAAAAVMLLGVASIFIGAAVNSIYRAGQKAALRREGRL